MPGHFGGISPVRQQQKARLMSFGLIGGGVLLVIVIIVFGVSAFSKQPNQPQEIVREVAAPIETVSVLVPLQTIEAGQELRPTMFKKEERPKAGLPPRVVRDFEEIKGYFSRSMIAADSPLITDYITQIKPSSVITARIPEGYRAVTIRVDAQSAVEGWVRPGAKVDVVWATTVRGKSTVSTIVENAEILSAESSTDAQQGAGGKAMMVPSTVTLMITAQDAQRIQLAKTTGTLSLNLRGDSDGKSSGRGSVNVDDLLRNGAAEETGPQCQGKVKLSGVEYCVMGGEMIPFDKLKSRKPPMPE
jgi:pilus assembly protein CpaB